MEKTVLDLEGNVNARKTGYWKLTVIVIALTAGNTLVRLIDANAGPFRERVYYVVLAYLITIPLVSLLLGLFGAFVPFKELSYRQRYLRAALLVMTSLLSWMLIVELIRVID